MNSTAIRSATIRKLSDVRMSDVAEVGGKAANLGELLAADVRVPDGVVMTAGAGVGSPGEGGSSCVL
jgi:phosphoenolpyruvate synthase/pyruvate phosphate dikinase